MKPMLHYFVAPFFALAALGAAAAEREYRTPAEFVKNLPFAAAIDQSAEGDLNGDGLNDSAILSGADTPRLYILLKTPSGGFRLGVESKQGAIGQRNVKLEIANGNLEVSMDDGAVGVERANYRFRLYKGVWKMISFQHFVTVANSDETMDHSVESSVNLLTGNAVFKNEITQRASGEARPYASREKATGGECMLAEFNFDWTFCVKNWKTARGQSLGDIMAPHF